MDSLTAAFMETKGYQDALKEGLAAVDAAVAAAVAKASPNAEAPQLDVEFIIEELRDLFRDAEDEKVTLTSSVGSRFHARVLNAARHLGLE